MTFKDAQEKLIWLMLTCGLSEVHNSKAQIPDVLPSGIISLSERLGEIKLMTGYARQAYKFEIHLIVDQDEKADEKLITLIEMIDYSLQDLYFTEVYKVEFYDSLLSSNNVRIARFEVVV